MPIVVKRTIALADLRGRRLAVDANGELYQFLALIRLRDGTPLKDAQGRITSHLSGLFYRTTRLIADFRLQLGPKKALALVIRFGRIEQMPGEIRDAFGPELDRLRQIYLEPDVHDDTGASLEPDRCDVEGVIRFLCDEHAFARDRVSAALERAFGAPKLF